MQGQTVGHKFSSLDSLRGLAATAVAVFHFSDGGWGGYLAVDFFLILSGFILSHSYLYKSSDTPPIAFISHRLARLYPLHIFTLFTFAIAMLLTSGSVPSYKDGNVFTFFQQLTLTHNVGLNPHGMTWNYPSWSISVEFWVNVLFIFLITKSTRNATLLTVAFLGLALIGLQTGHLDTHAANYFGFVNSGMVRGIASFVLGIVCYRVYRRFRDTHHANIDMWLGILEPVSLMVVLVIVFARHGNHSHTDLLAPLVFMIVVVVFAFERGWMSKQLNRLSYLGVISYSIYLNQITVLIVLKSWLDWNRIPILEFLGIYLVTLFVYSHLTYKYVEKPLRSTCRDWLAGLVPVAKV